jgi:hypothetical protein
MDGMDAPWVRVVFYRMKGERGKFKDSGILEGFALSIRGKEKAPGVTLEPISINQFANPPTCRRG